MTVIQNKIFNNPQVHENSQLQRSTTFHFLSFGFFQIQRGWVPWHWLSWLLHRLCIANVFWSLWLARRTMAHLWMATIWALVFHWNTTCSSSAAVWTLYAIGVTPRLRILIASVIIIRMASWSSCIQTGCRHTQFLLLLIVHWMPGSWVLWFYSGCVMKERTNQEWETCRFCFIQLLTYKLQITSLLSTRQGEEHFIVTFNCKVLPWKQFMEETFKT